MVMSSCEVANIQIPNNVNYTRRNICFSAYLEGINGRIDEKTVIRMEADESYTLSIESNNGLCRIGMMIFVNGIPIPFNYENTNVHYIEFDLQDHMDIHYTLSSLSIPNTFADIKVALFTNRDYYPKHFYDSMDDYLFVINYSAKGNGQPTILDIISGEPYESFENYCSYFSSYDTGITRFFYINEDNNQIAYLNYYDKPGRYAVSIFAGSTMLGQFEFYLLEGCGMRIPFSIPSSINQKMLLYAVCYNCDTFELITSSTSVIIPQAVEMNTMSFVMDYQITINGKDSKNEFTYNGDDLNVILSWRKKNVTKHYTGFRVYFVADGICRWINQNEELLPYAEETFDNESGKMSFFVHSFKVTNNEFDILIIIVPTSVFEPYIPQFPSEINFKYRCTCSEEWVSLDAKKTIRTATDDSLAKCSGITGLFSINDNDLSPGYVIVDEEDIKIALYLMVGSKYSYTNILFLLNGVVFAEYMPMNTGKTSVMKALIPNSDLKEKNILEMIIMPNNFTSRNAYDREYIIIEKNTETQLDYNSLDYADDIIHISNNENGVFTFTRIEIP